MVGRRIFITAVIFYICAMSCSEGINGIDAPVSGRQTGVFICNEGNFTFGNASLSFYNTDSNTVLNQVFQQVNGFPLGDVAHSMAIKDSLGYITVNNSGKVFVINVHDFTHVATISGLTSPRYIHFVNESKAYISELYSTTITIIDPIAFNVTGHIEVGKATEQMVQLDEFVYVTSWFRNNKIYKINETFDAVIDSLEVSKQPNSIQIDQNNKLWVLCDGGYEGIPGGKDSAVLYRIAPDPFLVESRFTFPVHEQAPSELCINATGDTLFFLNSSWNGSPNIEGGIYRMHIGQIELQVEPFIIENNKIFYGLGINPVNSDIFVSDAVDFQQAGWIFRYASTGAVVDSFKTGIIPGAFAFLN